MPSLHRDLLKARLEKPRKNHQTQTRRTLRKIYAAMYPPNEADRTDHIDAQVLAGLPIRIERLPFDCDVEIDTGTRFTKLYNAEQFGIHFETHAGRDGERLHWPESGTCSGQNWASTVQDALYSGENGIEWREDPSRKVLIDHSKWMGTSGLARGHNGCIDNLSEYGHYATQWYTAGIYAASGRNVPTQTEICDSELPHISCFLHHAYEDPIIDERVARNELICASHLIKRRAKYAAWNGHAYYPVFIYLFNSTHARITQAHFDGQYLQLRRTDPIPLFTSDRIATLKLLLRWFMAEPLPNTRHGTLSPELRDENKETPDAMGEYTKNR